MNDAKNESMLTRLGQSTKNAFHTLVRLFDAQRKAMSQAVRFMLRALLVGLMAIYAAGIGHATIVPIPIDDDLSIYIPCTDVSGSTETGGVTVTATPGGQSAVSDASGNYKLLCLPIGTYTLTPTKPSTTFVPASRLVSVPTAEDITIANISFNFGRTISGNVGIEGATITLMNGSLVVGTTTSDINGNYSFGSVGPGTFTLSVSKDRSTFSPASQTVTVAAGGPTSIDSSFSIASASVPGTMSGQFGVSAGGTANYSIPIQISPGTAGIQPSLSLNYDSRGGNGLVGLGFALSGLSTIHRCPATIVTDGLQGGINNDANDRFCLDGERLIVVNGLANGANGAEYRTQHESFNRITSNGACGSGPCWWRVESTQGQINEYGHTVDSALEPAGTAVGGVIRMWGVSKVYDRAGNYLTVTYDKDAPNGQIRPKQIDYTGNSNASPVVLPYNSVTFAYQENRPDILGPQYVGGATTKISSRLIGIYSYNAGNEVRRYVIDYDSTQTTSLVKTIRECVGVVCLPGTNFDWQYSTGTTQWAVTATNWGANAGNYKNVIADFSGDGIKDLLTIEKYTIGPGQIGYRVFVSYSTGTGFTVPVQVGIDPNVTAGDVNGDGKADLISNGFISLSNGVSFNPPTASGITLFTGASSRGSNTIYMFSGDVNGDGKDDIVYSQKRCDNSGLCLSGSYWALMVGSAFTNPTLINDRLVSSVGDVDGDGRAEILYQNHIARWNGNGFSALVAWDNVVNIGIRHLVDADGDGLADLLLEKIICLSATCSFEHYLSMSNGANFGPLQFLGSNLCGQNSCMFGDVTGDGSPDLVTVSGGSGTVKPMQSATQVLLIRVTNGLGAINEITYKPISDPTVYTPSTGSQFPYRDVLPQARLMVVASARSSDGIGGWYNQRNAYAGAKAHMQGGGMMGFASMKVFDDQAQTVKTSWAYQTWPFQGFVTASQVDTIGGIPLNRADSIMSTQTTFAGVYFSFPSKTTEKIYIANDTVTGSTLVNTVVTDTEYAGALQYGNTTKVTVTDGAGYVKTGVNNYNNDVPNWILGQLTCAAVTNTMPSGAAQTRTSSFVYQANGFMQSETVEPGTSCVGAPAASTDANLRVTTSYAYDAFGNRQSTTVTGGVTGTNSFVAPRTTYSYFEAQGSNPAGRFVTRIVNAMNQVERHEIDPGFGGITKLIGPNTLPTSWSYDRFGRKKFELRADGTSSTMTLSFYSGSSSDLAYSVSTTSTGAPTKIGYVDKLNRERYQTIVAFDGRTIVSGDSDLDNPGRVTTRYRNYFDNAARGKYSSFTYDAIGRVQTETHPATAGTTSSVTYDYNGLSTTVNRSTGRTPATISTTQVKNTQGQLVIATDANGVNTTYTYDPFGNLLTTTAAGVVTSMSYNLRGHKTGMIDPDMGTWAYEYSAIGELKKQTDAKAQITTMSYDLLGRLTIRSTPTFTSNLSYDKYANAAACPKGEGKLCEVTTTNGFRRTFSYDGFGRGLETTTYLNSVPYTVTNAYDNCANGLGKACNVTYPATYGTMARVKVNNVFNAYGYLTGVQDAATSAMLWSLNGAAAIDADGNITKEMMGNTLTTDRDYDPDTGRLKAIRTGSSALVQNLSYGFDHLAVRRT